MNNFNSYLNDGRRGQTPFTPAITIILQLQDRLRDVVNKGIGYSNKQAKDIAIYFRQNIEDLPLVLYSLYMPNAMTTLSPTDGKKAIEIVNILEKRYNCVVAPNGGELKDKIFRVSHMGAMTIEYTDILIDSLYDYYKIKRK